MIESFTDGISMQIVWCGHRLLDVMHGVQLGYYGIFKTLALITVNVGQDTIYIEPFLHYNLDNSRCLLVVGDEGLPELGEGISQYQDVFLPSLDGSTFRKSIHNRSRGFLVTSDPCCVCGPV